MRNVALGMAAAVVIGALALVGYQAAQGAPLTQFSGVLTEEPCRECVPGNGEINVDEEYSFGAEGGSGSLTFPRVVPCSSNGCHSGFFFAYQVIMRWKGNQSPVLSLGVETVTPITQGEWQKKQGGEWVRCIDMTFDPPTNGTTPTLTLTGATKVQVVGYIRYRFPPHDQFCWPYQ